MKPGPILAALALAAGITLTAACGNNPPADPYAHCYDEQGNYDDDIAGCPDDDVHIPTHRATKTATPRATRAVHTTARTVRTTKPAARITRR